MKKHVVALFTCCLSMFLLASCASNQGGSDEKVRLIPLQCIAVPPAGTSANSDRTIAKDQVKELEAGAEFVSKVMADQLAANPKVKILTAAQAASLVPEVSGGFSGSISHLGRAVQCDGVLLTTVHRFKERQGSEMAVDEPASAALQLVLYHTGDGAVLWSSEFRETQESFLENILSYNKMQGRGFKWITVEELVQEGVRDRLAQCPYLK